MTVFCCDVEAETKHATTIGLFECLDNHFREGVSEQQLENCHVTVRTDLVKRKYALYGGSLN